MTNDAKTSLARDTRWITQAKLGLRDCMHSLPTMAATVRTRGCATLFEVRPQDFDEFAGALSTIGFRILGRIDDVVADMIFHHLRR